MFTDQEHSMKNHVQLSAVKADYLSWA